MRTLLKRWRTARQVRRDHRRWHRDRENALLRASNGEHLSRREREELNLPDWTA